MREPETEDSEAGQAVEIRSMSSRVLASFPALNHRDFRLLWIGQLLSMSGSQMQSAAILWHVALIAPAGSKARPAMPRRR